MATLSRSDRQADEVDRNYEAFERMLPDILAAHRDQYALMKGREIVGFYDKPVDALKAGATLFGDGIFSIQEVTDEPIDLGIWSRI